MPRPPMSPEHAERRRAQILRAAYGVFSMKGYYETNIADIAAELGIGHGTFYRYFENKLDIFERVVDQAVRLVCNAVAQEPPRAATAAEYRGQVMRLVSGLFELLERDDRLGRLLFDEAPGVTPRVDARLEQAWDLCGSFTENYLRRGVEQGYLRAGLDASTTARAMNAMIFEGARRVLRADDRERERRRWQDAVAVLLFDGIQEPAA